MQRIACACALLTLAAAGEPATAQVGDTFLACDGYVAPKGKADGITKLNALFGAVNAQVDIRARLSSDPMAGIAACDGALGNAALLPEFWIRRASLLQAKAMYEGLLGRWKEAVDTIDRSTEIGVAQVDSLFAGSMGLANAALRAYFLLKLGQRDAAMLTLSNIIKARPYSASIVGMANAVELAFEPDPSLRKQILQRMVPLDPNAREVLFWIACSNRDFASALAWQSEASAAPPSYSGSYVLVDPEQDDARVRALVDLMGASAYASAAQGDKVSAEQKLAEAERIIREPPPKMIENGRAVKGSRDVPSMEAVLAQWTAAVSIRSGGTRPPIAMLQHQVPSLPFVVEDLLLAMSPTSNEDRQVIAEQLVAVRKANLASQADPFKIDLARLWHRLPRMETAAMNQGYRARGKLMGSYNGYYSVLENAPDTVSLTYGSILASNAMRDELAMLAAADITRKAGKHRFRLESRLGVSRGGYGPFNIPQYEGVELRMKVHYFDASSTADGPGQNDFDAQQVYDALMPRYRQP